MEKVTFWSLFSAFLATLSRIVKTPHPVVLFFKVPAGKVTSFYTFPCRKSTFLDPLLNQPNSVKS